MNVSPLRFRPFNTNMREKQKHTANRYLLWILAHTWKYQSVLISVFRSLDLRFAKNELFGGHIYEKNSNNNKNGIIYRSFMCYGNVNIVEITQVLF